MRIIGFITLRSLKMLYGRLILYMIRLKKQRLPTINAAAPCVIFKRALCGVLLADTELFLGNDCAVAGDVFLGAIVKKTTTLAYKHFKSALCCMIFVI